MSQMSLRLLRYNNNNMSGRFIRSLLFETKHVVKISSSKLSTTPQHKCSDKFKSDPDIKNLMRTIQDDFIKKNTITKEDLAKHNEDIYDNVEKSSNEEAKNSSNDTSVDDFDNDKHTTANSDSTLFAKKKDLDDLLTELYSDPDPSNLHQIQDEKDTGSGSSLLGYSRFKDQDATIIYDVEEERRIQAESGDDLKRDKKRPIKNKYGDISKKRGVEGVFDLHELVQVAKDERVADIAVIRIPKDRVYVDYFVIGTGRNARHIYVMSQIISKLYKTKASKSDINLSLEGVRDKGNSGWIAMDLGNIILHLFTQEKRDYYSLETLWTLGSEFDELSRTEDDPIEQLLASHIPPELLLEFEQQVQNSPQQEEQFRENNHESFPSKDKLIHDNKDSNEDLKETDFISNTLSGRNKDGRTLA